MRTVLKAITNLGNWLISLSDRTKKTIVLSAFVLLIGGSICKLVGSIDRLNNPQPMTSPVRLVEPMSRLYQSTQDRMNTDKQAHISEMSQLDSLLKARLPQNLNIK